MQRAQLVNRFSGVRLADPTCVHVRLLSWPRTTGKWEFNYSSALLRPSSSKLGPVCGANIGGHQLLSQIVLVLPQIGRRRQTERDSTRDTWRLHWHGGGRERSARLVNRRRMF